MFCMAVLTNPQLDICLPQTTDELEEIAHEFSSHSTGKMHFMAVLVVLMAG